MKSSLDTSKLSVGSYSFKQLCDILDEHSYTAYNKSLENRWRRYFDYTYDAEKKLFHVTYIKAAEEILPREKYSRNEPSKYDILHPTLLLILKLNSMQKYKINFTKLNLWLYSHHAVRNQYIRKRIATIERITSDTRHPVRNFNTRQACTAIERITSYTCQSVSNRNIGQTYAITERTFI